MRSKELTDARLRAKDKLEEIAAECAEVPVLIKLAKAGFGKALDRLVLIMDSDSPNNVDAAIAVYQLVKEDGVSLTKKSSSLDE